MSNQTASSIPSPNDQAWVKFNQQRFDAFQSSSGLAAWDAKFLAYLTQQQPQLAKELLLYRAGTLKPQGTELSAWLIELSIEVQNFMVPFFGIENESNAIKKRIAVQSPILAFKKNCVKKALKSPPDPSIDFDALHQWLLQTIKQHHIDDSDLEWAVASLYQTLEPKLPDTQAEIAQLASWCRQAIVHPKYQAEYSHWTSFALPERLDYMQMVPLETTDSAAYQAPFNTIKKRDGFDLTDQRMSPRQSLAEADYCVDCHEQSGDFCSTGFPIKKKDRNLGFRENPLGEILTGCPVEEKISEMHWLYKRGHLMAAFAMIMRDNPLCALTGHRICNECMKSCIYQKQTPVNIPQTETSILSQVLQLPWGVEIYDLLMKWNPLRDQQWCMQAHHGIRVLVMGMGPAGISLAHHLLMDGYTVAGMDGLKLEPLDSNLINQPIHSYADIQSPLSDRTTYGFGGVAEYGITVRWDKNFLKLMYILMMRRKHFRAYGGIRFGGTIKVEDAWALGFDHLAIAVGAGLPKALNIPHGLAPGVRQANDFLMALQLTGAFKKNSIVNLQVQLPAVVIGGGLTGVDTATEVQAYYVMQVERILARYEALCRHFPESKLAEIFNHTHPDHLNDFITHGKGIREERLRAKAANESPDFTKLIQQWGGVTIVYRKTMQESPAYRRNHEELTQAMREGILYAECLNPKAITLDDQGHCSALQCYTQSNDEKTIPAKSIFIATGAKSNIAYAFEHRETLERNQFEYQAYQQNNDQFTPVTNSSDHIKTDDFGAFTNYSEQGYRVTFLGDTHPVFHGNVIKAIASGQKTYPKINELFTAPGTPTDDKPLFDHLDQALTPTVLASEVLNSNITRLTIHCPWLVKQHRLGQFYRLQNLEATPIHVGKHALQMEALAMIPTQVNADEGTIQFLINKDTASARLAQQLTPHHAISLMGPTGNASKAEESQVVMFIGDFSALQLLLSLGDTLKAQHNRIYWMITPSCDDMVETQRIHELIEHCYVFDSKNQDAVLASKTTSIHTMEEGLTHCFQDQQCAIDRIYVSGSPDLLAQLSKVRREGATPAVTENTSWIANINAPMQCMLKGVCAQCLVWQQDPKTKQRTKSVYACSWHHQPMAMVDPKSLTERHMNNASTAKLNALWLEQLMD